MTESTYLFAIQSQTSTEQYELKARIDDGELSISCSCPAGWSDTICKHRLSILRGDPSMLCHPEDEVALRRLRELHALVHRTELHGLINQLAEYDKEINKLQREMRKAKRRLADAMDGVSIPP